MLRPAWIGLHSLRNVPKGTLFILTFGSMLVGAMLVIVLQKSLPEPISLAAVNPSGGTSHEPEHPVQPPPPPPKMVKISQAANGKECAHWGHGTETCEPGPDPSKVKLPVSLPDARVAYPYPSSSVASDGTLIGRALVLYAYYDADLTGIPTENLRYFVEVGMAGLTNVDYVFINPVCERVNIDEIIPLHQANVRRLCVNNDAKSDFCLWKQAVSHPDGPDTSLYTVIALLNSSVRGPILPAYELRHWLVIFASLLNEHTHLVGPSFSCQTAVHLQSFLLVLDQQGYRVAQQRLMCYKDHDEGIMNGEIQVARDFWDTGRNVASTMLYYSGLDFRFPTINNQTCNWKLNPTCCFGNFPYEFHIHPFEVVFAKNSGNILPAIKKEHLLDIQIYSEMALLAHRRRQMQIQLTSLHSA